jgi:8-oxo-dGTP pyrophosphatase MutT (NUDIX family)
MITKCGIILVNSDNKILLGHVTNSADNVWSIPKGEFDDDIDRSNKDCALREFKEETGLDFSNLQDKMIELSPKIYKNKKAKLIPFVLKINCLIEAESIVCNSLVDGKFPEIDKFKWYSYLDAIELVHHTQKEAIEYYFKNKV